MSSDDLITIDARHLAIREETTTTRTIIVERPDEHGVGIEQARVSNFGCYAEPRVMFALKQEARTREEFVRLVADAQAAFEEYDRKFGGK